MRRAAHALPRGELHVEVDDRQVRLVFEPRGWFGLTAGQSRALRRVGILVLAVLLAVVPLVVLGSLYGTAGTVMGGALAVLGTTLLAAVETTPSAVAFPPLTIDAETRTVRLGDVTLALSKVGVILTEAGWELTDGATVAFLSSALGAPRATWLDEVFAHARRGDLESIDLGPTVEPLAPPVDTRVAEAAIEVTHDGLHAELPPRSAAASWGTVFHETLPFLWLPFVFQRWGAVATAGATLVVVVVLIAYARRALDARRRRHERVHVDERWLTYRERATTHRVPLVELARVHRGRRAVQVERKDGGGFTLGHGWDADSLERLHDALAQAIRDAKPPGTPEAPVPESLIQLTGLASRTHRARQAE